MFIENILGDLSMLNKQTFMDSVYVAVKHIPYDNVDVMISKSITEHFRRLNHSDRAMIVSKNRSAEEYLDSAFYFYEHKVQKVPCTANHLLALVQFVLAREYKDEYFARINEVDQFEVVYVFNSECRSSSIAITPTSNAIHMQLSNNDPILDEVYFFLNNVIKAYTCCEYDKTMSSRRNSIFRKPIPEIEKVLETVQPMRDTSNQIMLLERELSEMYNHLKNPLSQGDVADQLIESVRKVSLEIANLKIYNATKVMYDTIESEKTKLKKASDDFLVDVENIFKSVDVLMNK